MRTLILLVVQLTIAFFVVGALMPAVLVNAPAARESARGMALTGVIFVGVFLLLRLIWPRPRRD